MPTNFDYPPVETQKELKCIVESLTTPGKGIFAADESAWKMGQRFDEIGLINSEELRRQWRELLFSTDVSISESISGVLLTEETLHQKDSSGRLLIELLRERCIIPGIKVDKGLVYLYTSDGELGTQGLDNLDNRLAQYKSDGCEFARWRSVFKIGPCMPSHHALVTNADMIARFASLCQSKTMCPIIEPEVVPDGDHTIERCQKVTETVLSFVFKALHDHHVFLEGIILKPNMITPGLSHVPKSKPEEIAEATMTTLRRMVPPAILGIFFSSGGQTEEEATDNLNAINLVEGAKPWRLTFAYGRALQASAIRVWNGKPEKSEEAQDVFLKRAQANGEASMGRHASEDKMIRNLMENANRPYSSPTTPMYDDPVAYFRPIVAKKSPHVNKELLTRRTRFNTTKPANTRAPKKSSRVHVTTPKSEPGVSVTTPEWASGVSATTPELAPGVSVTTPELAPGVSVTTPESASGVSATTPESTTRVSATTPESTTRVSATTPRSSSHVYVTTSKKSSRVDIAKSQVSLPRKQPKDDDLVDDKHADNTPEGDDEYGTVEDDAGDATTKIENFGENETVKDDENEAAEDDENETADEDKNEPVQDDENANSDDLSNKIEHFGENGTEKDDGNEAIEDDGNETVRDDENEAVEDDANEPVEDDENADADDSSNKIENFDRRTPDVKESESKNSPDDDDKTYKKFLAR